MNLNPIKANMTELSVNHMKVLFSYKTPVAISIETAEGRTLINYVTEKYWSRTTSRHINQWLGEAVATKKPQTFFDNLIAGVK